MATYRKKPVVIEAEVYKPGMEDGFSCKDNFPKSCTRYPCDCIEKYLPYIETLEGRHYISSGDYIITGVKGERYACKPDIFAMTYEPVEAGEDKL